MEGRVLSCKAGPTKRKTKCPIDWDEPDEQDEMTYPGEQCVNFWCKRCGWVLCAVEIE